MPLKVRIQKILYMFLILLAVVISNLSEVGSVYARSGDVPTSVNRKASLKASQNEDWRTFTQTDPRWGAAKIAGGTTTVYNMGCTAVTEAALMKATGLMPDDWNIVDYFDYCNSKGAYCGYAVKKNGYKDAPFDKCSDYLDFDEKKCLDALKHGYYVELRIKSDLGYDTYANSNGGRLNHSFIAVGYDDEGILMSETWDGYDKWADGIDQTTGLGRKFIKLYVGKDGKSPKDGSVGHAEVAFYKTFTCEKSKFTNNNTGSTTKSSDDKTTDDKTTDGSKDNIVPLSQADMKWYEEQNFVPTKEVIDTPTDFSKIKPLTGDEALAVQDWNKDITDTKESTIHSITRGVVLFLGVVISVYSLFVYVAYQFDCNQNFIDISLLSILTLGRIKASPDNVKSTYGKQMEDEGTSSGVKFVTHKDVIVMCLIGIAIGVSLLSGQIFNLIYKFVNWVFSLLK